MLIKLVAAIPQPPPAAKRGRGHPPVYSERLFLKALVVMIVGHLPAVGTLLAVLEAPARQEVRALLLAHGRSPARRTWERRLNALPVTLPAQLACVGRPLVLLLTPWAQSGRAVAIDRTPWRACGGVGPKKDREAAELPHPSSDTEAPWTKAGGPGWVYGGKLPLITTGAAVGSPLAAAGTPANVADNEQAPALLEVVPTEVRFVVGAQHDNDAALRDHCTAHDRVLVPPKRGPYPPQDEGVAVRRIFHELRARASENVNGQFTSICDCRGQVPRRGRRATRRFVRGAVLVYQRALLHRFETGDSLRAGLQPLLKAA